jgi:Fic family protein
MEGIDISMFDLWDTYTKKEAGISSVESYLNAVKYGCSHIHKTRTPLKLFSHIYRILTGCHENSEMVLIWKEQIFTKPFISVVGMRTYNPPNPDNVKESCRAFEPSWDTTCKYDVLIQAALIHYQFCTIQPFLKDNDRITRILTCLFMIKRKIISQPSLCLSYFFNQDRIGYIDRLNHVRRDISDSYEPWFKYFVKAIAIAAERTNEVLALLEKTRREDNCRLHAIENVSKHILAVYEKLWDNPIVETRQITKVLDISYNTAAKAIAVLIDLNILEQIGEQSRYRRFSYRKLFDVFGGLALE